MPRSRKLIMKVIELLIVLGLILLSTSSSTLDTIHLCLRFTRVFSLHSGHSSSLFSLVHWLSGDLLIRRDLWVSGAHFENTSIVFKLRPCIRSPRKWTIFSPVDPWLLLHEGVIVPFWSSFSLKIGWVISSDKR